MTTDYLQEAARVMGQCLSGPTGALSINPELDRESLTIYLAVACTTLGRERTRRIVVGEEFRDRNKHYEHVIRELESLESSRAADATREMLHQLLLVGDNRQAVLRAGMDEKTLHYIIQDATAVTGAFLAKSKDSKLLSNRLNSLTKAVCEEANAQIKSYSRDKTFKDLERALKVIGGAAARITAAKLTGGVSEVLAALGDAAIDRGLGN